MVKINSKYDSLFTIILTYVDGFFESKCYFNIYRTKQHLL